MPPKRCLPRSASQGIEGSVDCGSQAVDGPPPGRLGIVRASSAVLPSQSGLSRARGPDRLVLARPLPLRHALKRNASRCTRWMSVGFIVGWCDVSEQRTMEDLQHQRPIRIGPIRGARGASPGGRRPSAAARRTGRY